VRRDQLAEAEEVLRHGRQLQSGQLVGFGLFNWAQAMVADAKGDLDRALEILEPAFAAFFRAGAVGADPWTTTALVTALIKSGQRERAAEVAAVLEQAEGDGTASIEALRLRCRGLVDGDRQVLLRSLEEYRRSGRRVDFADVCVDVAVTLLEDGHAEDADPYLDEALQVYEDVGAVRDIALLRAVLRARGVARGARGRRVRASTGWESLTESELRVVALVAQRMSNPEVAERLFVSRHTVESHLKTVYRKLGISSRAELAAAAATRSGV